MGEANTTILPCPTCGQRLRVPTDRGNLRLTCPKCRAGWDWDGPAAKANCPLRDFRTRWRNEAIRKGLACALCTLFCAGLLAGLFSCGAARWPWWFLLSPAWPALLGGVLIGAWMTRLALDVAIHVDAYAEEFLRAYGPVSPEHRPALQPGHTPTGIIPIPGEFNRE